MQIGFRLILTKAMLEFLCAVSDDVCWDRGLYWKHGAIPENFIASSQALIKRGLIEPKTKEQIDAKPKWETWEESCEISNYVLTPAGRIVVSLVKMAGMFELADAAINKQAKRA